MAQCRHEYDIRIFRIDDDRADVAGISQANVSPGASAVDRLVDAVAVGNIAANACFARADVDDVVVARRYRDRADRGD